MLKKWNVLFWTYFGSDLWNILCFFWNWKKVKLFLGLFFFFCCFPWYALNTDCTQFFGGLFFFAAESFFQVASIYDSKNVQAKVKKQKKNWETGGGAFFPGFNNNRKKNWRECVCFFDASSSSMFSLVCHFGSRICFCFITTRTHFFIF